LRPEKNIQKKFTSVRLAFDWDQVNSVSLVRRADQVNSVKMRVRLATYLMSAPLFSVALAVAPAPSPLVERASDAALVAHLMDREKSSWTALQQHDKQAWKSILSDSYSHVNSSGIRMDRAEVLNMFADEVVEGYSLHDIRGTLLCPDVVLVSYWIERTSKSTGAFASNSIWVKRTGNWLRLQYQETPMSPPPSNPGNATRSLLPSRDEWQ
jgi:hypothetical protein